MHRRISRNLCSLLKVHYAMEEVVRAYEVLKKTRTIKKSLLTRCVNRLRAVVGQGADVQADTVDDARRRARLLLEELNNINLQMETVLLENDIAREDDEEGVSRPTARFVDVESNVEEVTAREIEIDKLQTGWTHDTQPADANANADVLAKTLEALSIITDKLVTPRESASIRTTRMHPPRWDGQNKNFYSWRLQLEQYFNSAGISKEADKLMYILHASVLPSRVTASIDSCTAMSGPNGVWCRLEEKIPKAAVVQEIIADMDGIRPIRQNTASEMRAVLDRLTDFARRITEIGNESELDSPTVVRIVSSKLEPELYYECERWMRQNHPAEQLSVNRIVEFLRAETEARERLMPAKSTRTEKKSSLHHVNGTGTSFTDPCILGCGVHHKFIDCQAFQAMQPAQRRDVIRTDGRCFSCYGRHRSSDCTRPKRCIECGDRHHRLLNCQPNRQLSAPTSTTRRASPPTSQMNPASASFTPQQGAATSTPTFLGHLHGNQGRFSPSTYVEVRDSTGAWHKIVAFLDTGSDTTLVRHSLAKRLGITGDDQVFRYGVAGGGVRSEKSARYVLRVRPVQRDASIAYDINAMGIKVPAHDAPAIDSSLFQQYEYLQPARDCVPLAKEKIDLLVGYDQAYLISTLHTISSPTNEAQLPSAACTRLGWVLYGGQIQPPRAVARSAVHHVQRLIEDDIKKLFYSDVAGVKPTTACICSDKELAESKFLLHAKTTTSITKEGRIKVFMPWRDGYPEALPFNKEKTVARMYQQENSLRRNGRLEAYNAEIRNLITQGFVRPLTIEETHDGRGWYLEHHAVYREDKSTTKTRIVWNAAALFKGVSLNDGFHKGPDLLNSLISCLLAWRRDRVALVGDVKKMFNQIEVAEPDQIFHRFVWRFGDECSPPIAFQWIRLPFGERPAPDIAINSVRILAEIGRQSEPIGSYIVDNEMYMDDISHSTAPAEDAIRARDFWVDSQTVLKWVRSASANFKPFVSARIQEIQDTHPRFMDEFRYVPSNMNAADALTKPLSVRELQYWHEGPLFLRQHEDTWPQESTCEQDSEIEAATRIEGRNEKARTSRHRRIHHVRANDVCIADMTIADRLVAQVSEWDRLTRHVARWRRILQPRVNLADTRTIGAEELKDAQQALFFLCQSEFREDFAACRSTFASIAPVLDAKGIVRAEGRIGQLPLHPDVCHPIILPGNSPLVELYARRKHIRYLHQGYRVVLANIAKEGIHIGNGKELLKSVASKCLYCRTRRESMLQQQMGILPTFRGNPCTPPFAAVAVDFFGPLQTKVSRNVTTESSVMIVTCTTTRVVHLELTSSASTESFLLAWRRFVSRRGVHPTTVFSDRGKNFQGAQRPLRDAIDSWDVSRLKRELAAERTHFEWQFNVPKASHMNGVVESLIRSCRRGLDAAVNYLKRRFTFEEWQTFLSEVMYVINSRPLFPDGPDPVGSPAVTGNDILHPFDQPTVPQPVVEDRPHPRDVVKALHQRVQLFWETWMRYMPPHLIARSKWFHSRQNLQVGDLVLLLEPGMKGAAAPRALWERAVVTAVQPGDDGLVRKATVRTANARLYDRPIHKMCLIATDDELSNGLRRK